MNNFYWIHFIKNQATGTYGSLHDKICGAGWDRGINIIASSAEECFNECNTRLNVGYFSYTVSRPAGSTPDTCACYLEKEECPKGTSSDSSPWKSYQIDFEGIIKYLIRLYINECVSISNNYCWQNDYKLILVLRYSRCFSSIQTTCKDNIDLGHQKVAGKEACIDLCNLYIDCNFIFLTNKNLCMMYKSCDEMQRLNHIGSTYAKTSCPGKF